MWTAPCTGASTGTGARFQAAGSSGLAEKAERVCQTSLSAFSLLNLWNKGVARARPPDQASARMEKIVTIRLLTITALSLTMTSVTAYAGYGTAGTGWNQVAADQAARAYAAEGKCYPFNGPCSAPQPAPRLHRTPYATQPRKWQPH
jgi:uncharacterized low-complexity protein